MTRAQRSQIHLRISFSWEEMGAVMTPAFLDQCIEIVEDVLHPEPVEATIEFEEPALLTDGRKANDD